MVSGAFPEQSGIETSAMVTGFPITVISSERTLADEPDIIPESPTRLAWFTKRTLPTLVIGVSV